MPGTKLVLAMVASASLLLGACAQQAVVPRVTPQAVPTSAAPDPTPSPSQPEAAPSPTTPSPLPSITEPPTQETAPPAPPAPPALLEAGDEGDPVRDLQHRLLQLEWFSGKITGVYGDDTVLAIEGFQAKRGITVTGEVDQATLDRLHSMTRQPTQDEMHNILRPGPALLAQGSTGDGVKDVQAR
ncbi:MAG TPA: peptidoglycan-binding domain-containing protein, partial [Arachnia sp.]|nr:peptidoglycan-binding domain-containing protein [Arachnia sp.]